MLRRIFTSTETVERSWRLAIATVGQVHWELIEPLDEESVYARFLAETGEGVQHVAVGTPNFDETVAQADRGPGEEFDAARERLLAKEKAATRTLDALAAERRRQPVVPVDAGYVFLSPEGEQTLLELFQGRLLIVYHFMGTSPDPEPCGGCSTFTEHSTLKEYQWI